MNKEQKEVYLDLLSDHLKLEWLWKNCKIIYHKQGEFYPLEHNAKAQKDSRALIEAEMGNKE